jgi:hypothetical protein
MIKKLYSNSFNYDNQTNFLLSWRDPIKTINYNLYKKKLLINDIKRSEKLIAYYLKNVPITLSTNSQIETPINTSLTNNQIANTKFVQELFNLKNQTVQNIYNINNVYQNVVDNTTVNTINNITSNNTSNSNTYSSNTSNSNTSTSLLVSSNNNNELNNLVKNIINTMFTENTFQIPLNFTHITTSPYDITSTNSGNFVIEVNTNIYLPITTNLKDGIIFNLINKSNDAILLYSSDDTMIYNFFLKPNGGKFISIPKNSSLNIIFIVNYTSNINSWQVNFC